MHSSVSESGTNAELNVTPMLDVMLVLLVIFMAASVRFHRTLDAQLPDPCAAICVAGATITLEVFPGPNYRLNGVTVPSADLGSAVRQVYENRPEKVLFVAGRPGVTYESVVAAMDIARSNGVRVVGISPKTEALQR